MPQRPRRQFGTPTVVSKQALEMCVSRVGLQHVHQDVCSNTLHAACQACISFTTSASSAAWHLVGVWLRASSSPDGSKDGREHVCCIVGDLRRPTGPGFRHAQSHKPAVMHVHKNEQAPSSPLRSLCPVLHSVSASSLSTALISIERCLKRAPNAEHLLSYLAIEAVTAHCKARILPHTPQTPIRWLGSLQEAAPAG